jgi:two-component system response regulator AtoC
MTDRQRNTFSGATLKDTASGGGVVLVARTTLVFYHRDGAITAHLEKGRSLIVGRAAPSEIEIHDLNLSRQHARFSWDDHGLWVEDLGSTNGTKKNGEPVRETAGRVRIAPGDEVSVGPVKVSVHVLSSIDEELRGFDGHDRFVAALEEELTRARTFARPLALCMVRGNAKDDSGHVSRWGGRVRAQLRPVDRVGIYGPHAVLVSLPETTVAGARAFVLSLTGGTPPLSTTVVAFPEDGASVEELISAVQAPARTRASDDRASGVIAKSAAMKSVMSTVKKVAQSTIAVLITGETGTGKEVLARAIHEGGTRKKMPLRSINCAAIPGTLIESVLFGHEHGAFTGADKQAKGIFEQAQGGTVLLDEIGELAPSAQAALLRVLETKKVTRVGGDKEIDVDVRVIAATHRDLEAMVEAGRFRQDLLYRLNTMTIRLPPLRERTDEIKPLAERFLQEAAKQANNDVRSIDPKALAALEQYSWPGNVRELRNAIDRAVALAENKTIMLADLTERIRGSARTGSTTTPPDSAGDGALPSNYKDHLKKYEADLIVKALHKFGGNQTEAAKALGLPLRTLVHKIQTYGIKKKFDR